MDEELAIGAIGVHKVTYRRLKNLGNYENETVEVEAIVLAGQTPEQVLRTLRNWVTVQMFRPEDSNIEQAW